MTRSLIQLSVFFALITLALVQPAVAQQLEVTPFMKLAMDELGKTAGWRIKLLEHKTDPARDYAYAIKKDKRIGKFASANSAAVAARNQEPGVNDSPKASKAVQPSRRTDANSILAHNQLIEKAKSGGIDVYFAGDSITRRWGCSDPQYADLLANWKKNFFGWNAGNFGWGGDTTENILWRLENGELDGVNPKVIVVLAGTNNLSEHLGKEAQVKSITDGIKAIVGVCRQKAPDATIIVTAILPRNDKTDMMPTINQVNENIKKLADGKKIRFLNINEKLAGNDGTLIDGVTVDKFHLTVKGYQIWADGLKPILTNVLGPPAMADHAPPPTGDPAATRISN